MARLIHPSSLLPLLTPQIGRGKPLYVHVMYRGKNDQEKGQGAKKRKGRDQKLRLKGLCYHFSVVARSYIREKPIPKYVSPLATLGRKLRKTWI